MWLSSQAKHRRCAVCWGPVVLKWVDGEWLVVCPRGCQPGGHVSEEYVEYRRRRDASDLAKVRANYPQFAKDDSTPEQLKQDREALWPEGNIAGG